MRWSQLKKRIMNLLAESVKDRIDFGSTTYRHFHNEVGRGWILFDGREIINMCSATYDMEYWGQRHGMNEPHDKIAKTLAEHNIFAQTDFHRSLFDYLNLSINDILASDNEIIRAVGMIDARLGKRRLKTMDVSQEHDLVKKLYYFRCEAEGVSQSIEPPEAVDITSAVEAKRLTKSREDPDKSRKAADKLSSSKSTRKLSNFFARVMEDAITEEALDTEFSKIIYRAVRENRNAAELSQALIFIDGKSKLIKDTAYIRGIIDLAKQSDRWLRPLEEWKVRSHNPDKQFASLARHLLAEYPVPSFMDRAWLTGNETHQEWFIHIGGGDNIRSVENLPIPMTKKCAHHFLLAPHRYSIEAALRWGQVHALGGDERLADSLLDTRLVEDFRNHDFWSTVIQFFIRNPMLDTVHINPFIDYIWHMKYENRRVFVERGVVEEIGPEQPNFTMRGRTVDTLLRQVENWHGRLGRETKGRNLQWKKSVYRDFQFIEGSKQSKNMKIWTIRELLSGKELIAEGRQQKHCVATYVNSCHTGKCSIWTMDVETEEGLDKRVTIEVNHAESMIRQVRGKINRFPTEKEMEMIKRWSMKEGLDIASYVSGR